MKEVLSTKFPASYFPVKYWTKNITIPFALLFNIKSPLILNFFILALFPLYFFNKIPVTDYLKLWGYVTFFHFLPGFYVFSLIFQNKYKINTGVIFSFPFGIALNAFLFFLCKKINFDYYWVFIVPINILSLSSILKKKIELSVQKSFVLFIPFIVIFYLSLSLYTIHLEPDALINLAQVTLIENGFFEHPITPLLNQQAGYILAHLDILACSSLTNIPLQYLTTFLYPCYGALLFFLCFFFFLQYFFKSSIYFYIILFAFFMSNLLIGEKWLGFFLNDAAQYSFGTISGILGFLNIITLTFIFMQREKLNITYKNFPFLLVIFIFLFLAKAASSIVFMFGISINLLLLLWKRIIKEKKLSHTLFSQFIKENIIFAVLYFSFFIFLFYFMGLFGGGGSWGNHLRFSISDSLGYLKQCYNNPIFSFLQSYFGEATKVVQMIQFVVIAIMSCFYLAPFLVSRIIRVFFTYSARISNQESLFWSFFIVGFILSLTTYASGGGSHLSFLMYASTFSAILACFELKRILKRKLNIYCNILLFLSLVLLFIKVHFFYEYNPKQKLQELAYFGNGFVKTELEEKYDKLFENRSFDKSDIIVLTSTDWFSVAYAIFKTKTRVITALPFTLGAYRTHGDKSFKVAQLIEKIRLNNSKDDKKELQDLFPDNKLIFLTPN